jgi:hypothetical protein
MAKQLTLEFDLAKLRARQLGVSIREMERTGMGAYPSRPVNLIEHCLHEAGHLVTLGYSPLEFHQLRRWHGFPLSKLVSMRFERLSYEAADQLEVDTARIAFVAGQKLEIWDDDAEPIIMSAARNLSTPADPQTTRHVEEAFRMLKLPRWSGWDRCQEQASMLAQWFVSTPG